MSLTGVTPILRIFDEAKAIEFYVDYLGFEVNWRHRFDADAPLYLEVCRDACIIHLSEHHGDASPGAALRIESDGLENYHRQLAQKKYRYARPAIETMPWGTRDMKITDPFGNRLIFSEAGAA